MKKIMLSANKKTQKILNIKNKELTLIFKYIIKI